MPNNNFKKQPKLRRVNTNLINTNIIKSNMSKFLWKKLQSSVVNAQKNYDKFVNQYNQDVKNSVENIAKKFNIKNGEFSKHKNQFEIMSDILDDILLTLQTDRDNFVTIEHDDKVDEQKKKTLQTHF